MEMFRIISLFSFKNLSKLRKKEKESVLGEHFRIIYATIVEKKNRNILMYGMIIATRV